MKKDYKIEFTGQSKPVVLKMLLRCCFMIKKFNNYISMGSFVSGTVLSGKPAVARGYGWDILMQYISKDVIPPSQICFPDALEESIDQLVTDQAYLRELGEKIRRLVKEKRSLRFVVECCSQIIELYNIIRANSAALLNSKAKKSVSSMNSILNVILLNLWGLTPTISYD